MCANKVLVTGASGYLAGHVIQQLQGEGHLVRGTVRSLQRADKVRHLYGLCPQAAHPLTLVEADLMDPASWDKAVQDMDYVIHVASPFPLARPRDENDVIKPAVEGTLNVLKASAKVTSLKRVVLTSSCAAIYAMSENTPKAMTEADWSDVTSIEPYAKSKTLAEKAAWDFVKNLHGDERFELSVINPSMILGPPLHGSQCTSVEVIQQLLERHTPMVPHLNMPMVDVRDVALAHVRAMTEPEAAGHRHICTNRNLWLHDVANVLKAVFGPQGYNIPTTRLPKGLLWMASWFDARAKSALPHVDHFYSFDNTRMREVLRVEPREIRDTLVDMAYALVEAGFVRKTSLYKGPGRPEERDMYLKVPLS